MNWFGRLKGNEYTNLLALFIIGFSVHAIRSLDIPTLMKTIGTVVGIIGFAANLLMFFWIKWDKRDGKKH